MPRAFLAQFCQHLPSFLEPMFLHFTQPPQPSRVLALETDLTRPKGELSLENALHRQQLGILQRHVNKPRFASTDRLSAHLLASRLPNWKQARLILKPDTLLNWYRQGFKLIWRLKAHTRLGCLRLSKDLIALIQSMGQANHTWGAERIRGELLKLDSRVAKSAIKKCLRRTRPRRSPRKIGIPS